MRRQGGLAQYVLYEHVQVRLFGWSGDENLAAHAKRRQVKVRLLRDVRQRHGELADGGELHRRAALTGFDGNVATKPRHVETHATRSASSAVPASSTYT